MRMPSPSTLLCAVVCSFLLPASVQAQGTIVGQVDDASGSGLPGVTVDAIGVAIYDNRIVMNGTAITDENGRYQLDLPSGLYSVRFSLLGFGIVIHETIGIEDNCRVPVDARLWQVELREGVTVQGVHPYAAPSSVVGRLPDVSRDTRRHRRDRSAVTPLERAPRPDRRRNSIERQLFWKHIEDACLGYVPMSLSHLEVVIKQRPCQVT